MRRTPSLKDAGSNENPLISIIMTTRNGEKFLAATLESIISQSYRNWELVVVNNQSRDKTLRILKDYARNDQRIKVYTNPGLAEIIHGLRYGFANSQGEFITRMDSDDLMIPHKLATLMELLTLKGRGYLATGCIAHFSDSQVMGGFKRYDEWLNQVMISSAHFEEVYRECVIPSSCWMIHRQDFLKCGGFGSEVYPEDYDLCFRFYSKGIKIITSEKILHLWREHPDRISRTDSRYKDQLFYDLKLNYFLKLDWKQDINLAIWGAGQKGKKLALKLGELGIGFTWICNNRKKIGHYIYNTMLYGPEKLKAGSWQVLIAVSAKEREDISKFLDDINVWYRWFC